jgi:hypothetical protein
MSQAVIFHWTFLIVFVHVVTLVTLSDSLETLLVVVLVVVHGSVIFAVKLVDGYDVVRVDLLLVILFFLMVLVWMGHDGVATDEGAMGMSSCGRKMCLSLMSSYKHLLSVRIE